mmetsp:Transcript_33970/g.45900  ORF Transcript_33970/g.45900 Transcript_33970/m.45900 type:complete len:554 (-) Transcript_33970:369-2030(-)|eukprot:CAMPEP_0185775832 /NCGR_PEP_ID=MMETSP1174-20130828/83427_1 /TAXON_ID=35687 /ORGANISM="Dictyocha speculum, Strain CCMP1381" /LENGTH=553 /DNA_ID=CAMNT_0028463531 /DNA_START=76 /DNA_END=1737 /DNA_ORIENTATION=-
MTQEQRESDFMQLQKEYRIMEMNRKAYAEESFQVIRKQQENLVKLRQDNDALKGELSLDMRYSKSSMLVNQQRKETLKLRDEIDNYIRQIMQEKQNNKETSEKVRVMKSKILHQRKVMGGVNAARENQAMVQKQIRILENRLDKSLIKFNEALSHNKKLRVEIDDLRKERAVFDGIYSKVEKELYEKKKQMANIIELSNAAYEARDSAQMEIASIEQMNRKEQDDFEEQMMTLGQLLNTELGILPDTTVHEGGQSNGTLSVEDENKMVALKNKGNWRGVKDKVDLQASLERVQNFEDAFNRIIETTGISDVDELVRLFIKNEDQNFSLFNYVNEQATEMEKLEEQIKSLEEEEKKFASESGDDVNQDKQLLDELDEKLTATRAKLTKYEDRCEETQGRIDKLKKAIQRCAADMETSTVGDSCTEANILQYLGLIEQRCNDVLKQYSLFKAKERESSQVELQKTGGTIGSMSVLGLGPETPMGQDLIHVNPPRLDEWSSDEASDDDDDTKPLTRQEIQDKTLSRMNRKMTDLGGSSRKASVSGSSDGARYARKR